MQSATNLINIGYRIRKLEQFENQNSDIYIKPMEAAIWNV